MLDLYLLQKYVDTALAELHITNTGRNRVTAEFDPKKPGLARVRVHAKMRDEPYDFAERLASLCHRYEWSAELDGPEKYVEITSH